MLTLGRALILCGYLSAVVTGGILVSMMLLLAYWYPIKNLLITIGVSLVVLVVGVLVYAYALNRQFLP